MTICTGLGPKGVDSNAIRLELLGHGEGAHGHAVLGHAVGDVTSQPGRAQVDGWGYIDDVGVLAFLQVRKAQLRPKNRRGRLITFST